MFLCDSCFERRNVLSDAFVCVLVCVLVCLLVYFVLGVHKFSDKKTKLSIDRLFLETSRKLTC